MSRIKLPRPTHYSHLKNLLYPSSRTFSSQPTPLQNAGPVASLLKSRAVVRFRGPDTIKFLQGLLTNDLRQFAEPASEKTFALPTPNLAYESTPPVYAAMLTPQGRFLYDFFIYRPLQPKEKLNASGSGPGAEPHEVELYADVDASVLDELLDTMKKYRLRSNIDIESMAETFSCWQRYGSKLTEDPSSVEEPEAASVGWGGTVDQSGVSASRGNDVGWQWYKDPRLSCLGFRGIFPTNSIPPLVEADKEADERNYLMWRIENGVAEGSTEIPKGEAMPLEYNFVGLNAISFDKGCYVGQELIARTHHRGVIRKRLLPLKFVTDGGKEGEQKVASRLELINYLTGKKVGSVTTALGSRGLGLVRLEEVFKVKGSLAIQGNDDVKVEAIRPKWWPFEWFLEYQQQTAAA